MIIKNVNLETVCGITSAIPDNLLDEVAFAGKSNVGKSSLINALMNRKSLARTSSQPGKTQTINFYNVNEAMYLPDRNFDFAFVLIVTADARRIGTAVCGDIAAADNHVRCAAADAGTAITSDCRYRSACNRNDSAGLTL